MRLILLFLVFFSPISLAKIPPKFPSSFDDHLPSKGKFSYDTKYFTQILDHFNFNNLQTFQQRYLLNDKYWGGSKNNAPIFVYTGNEGNIEWFTQNTGFMFEIAPHFNALLVFIEHRYYGKSIPYGGDKTIAYSNKTTLGYLSSTQALADYATLIIDLKNNLTAINSPVVVFGGSYGGMLAAWFRLKYPHVTIGALASSAPILNFGNITSPYSFNNIITRDFKGESENCYKVIKGSWKQIEYMAKTKSGLEKLRKSFRICKNYISQGALENWLYTAFVYTAMTDYPTPSNFLNPLPAYPVKQMCKAIDDPKGGKDTFEKIYGAASPPPNLAPTQLPTIMAFSSPLFSPVNFTLNPNPQLNHPKCTKPNNRRNLTVCAIPPLSTATDISAVTDSLDGKTLAVLGGSSVAALAAILSLADPERRRQLQAEEVGGGDKEVVREYFNNNGFQRWKKIYGDTDDVNKVQLDIRLGHSKTVENVMKMLTEEGSLQGVTVCDAGCGTGCLSIPLAKEGAIVSASDISASMVAEAQKQAQEELFKGKDDQSLAPVMPKFEVKDLESLDGKYDTVVCLDVMIHYPQSKADGMIAHLASLAENRLILSFAPKTFYYDLLKRIGELFPGPSKATRAYLHAEADVERALQKAGWKIKKRGLIATQFYFAKLIEAVPA